MRMTLDNPDVDQELDTEELDNQDEDNSSDTDNEDNPGEEGKTFSQEDLNKFLAREKRKWQRAQRKQKTDTPNQETNKRDNAPDDVAKLMSEISQERAMLKFERWAAAKGIPDKAVDLLAGKADLADPDSWEDVYEDYSDLLAPRQSEPTKQRSKPPRKGSPNPQPDSDRPRVGPITKDQALEMSEEELMAYMRKQWGLSPKRR